MSDENPYTVEATETSLTVLETLVESEGSMGVTALADHIGVSKSAIHNHLSTLGTAGYVIKREDQYAASLRPLNLGVRTRSGIGVYRAAKKKLDNLAAATGETAALFVLEEDSGVPAYIVETADGWSPPFNEGGRLPLHVNAPGKSILASLPSSRSEEILRTTELTAPTDAVMTDPGELRDELRRISDDGIAFSRGEQFEGVVGVAAPLPDGSEDRAAALGIWGSVERLTGRYLEEDIMGQVLSTAKSVRIDLTAT